MEKNNLFKNRIFIYTIITIIVVMGLLYLGQRALFNQLINQNGVNDTNNGQGNIKEESNMASKNPIVTIKMADGGVIKVELYPDIAPNTVRNFISLVKKDYYNGVIFHRVIKGFMIQGGDPDGTGMGGPGYSIKGEFSQNGFDNSLKHSRGVISMARSMNPDSAGSQFFIMHQDSPHLDGQYAAFGKVIEGMDVVDKIAGVETAAQDRPVDEQVMEDVSVDTSGVEYEEPEKA